MSSSTPSIARLEPYVIEREVGRGGMATVYAAVHERLGRRVAIKVVSDAIRDDAIAMGRFSREAKLLATLHHPHIVAATDLDTWEGRAYFVMDLLEGPTLAAHLRAREHAKAPLSLEEISEIFLPITAAVAAAHARSIVHRDLKPSNVLLARREGAVHPTVLDFGISTSLGAEDEQKLTRSGAVIGTVSYLSPEQTRGAAYASALSDEYALGVMLYECATGRLPFRGESPYETMHAIVTGDAPPPSTLRSDLPEDFDAIVLRAMDRDKVRRFGSVRELGRAILGFASEDLRARWGEELGAARESEGSPAPVETTLTEGDSLREARPPAAPAPPAAPPIEVRGRWMRWLPALLGVALIGGTTAVALRGQLRRAAPAQQKATSSVGPALAALAGPDAPFACPIFAVHGIDDDAVAARLGAAAASVACARESWNLGGRDDRVLPPAALLGLPKQPVGDLADPYATPDRRARTLALARARAAAYVDGTVTYDHDWRVQLVIRTPDDSELDRAEGRDPTFSEALKRALDASWSAPLPRRPIDPDVARWTGLPDVAPGITATNAQMMSSADGCAAVRARAPELGNAFFSLEEICETAGAAPEPKDAGTPKLDESSAPALVLSVNALIAREAPLSIPEGRRLALELDALRSSERSSFGRAQLAMTAASLWALGKEPDRAQASLLVALREDPLLLRAWHLLVTVAGWTGSPESAAAVASAWFPRDGRFVAKAASYAGDEIAARLRDAELAYILEPGFVRAMHFGRALAEAGRTDEARTIAATTLSDPATNELLSRYVLAFIDLHTAKLGQAIPRLEQAGDIALIDLVAVADVAGQSEEIATRWATRFLALSDADASMTARGFDAPMVLCMRARHDLGPRCLDRIASLGHATVNWWGDGGEALLAGARRYAANDVNGAVASWRALVAGPNLEIVRVLPTEAFERAGEPDLAARLDARKMAFTFIAGVSEAAPREARRARAAGSFEVAKTLAEHVIQAWEVADVSIPAVGQMRAILGEGPLALPGRQ